MKRVEQLHKLSKEHHGSLVMAKKVARIAEEGNDQELLDTIKMLREYYDNELEEHFQHEERTIFTPIFQHYKEHIEIATLLLKEHGAIRVLLPRLTLETAKNDLADFAKMLKDHTRTEERELFPIIESLFTDEELDAILNFKPLP